VQYKEIKFRVVIVATSLLLANSAYAFDMGNMMNPSKWMGGNKDNDRDDDYYYDEPGYGYFGASGTGSNEAEIMRLKERLRQLEGSVR
jgi:hypothetical protein